MLQDRLRSGEFDREILIIKKNITVGDANSDYNTGWTPIASNPVMMAKRVEQKGSEVVINDRVTFIQKTYFIIRYRDDVTVSHRIKFEGVIYEIISITETQGRRRFLELVCNRLDTETT